MLLALAIAADLACGQYPQHRRFIQHNLPIAKQFVLSKSWRWPNTVSGTQLASTSTTSIFRHCALGVGGVAASTWNCVASNGTSPGSWTLNTGLATAPTFIEGVNAFYADVTGGPQLTSDAALDTVLNGAYTIVVTGYTKQPAAGSGWWFQSLGTGAIAMLYSSGNNQFNDGAASLNNTKTCVGLWCFMSFRSDGSGNYKNKVDATQVTGTGAHTAISSGTHTFGNRSAKDLGIEGYIISVDIYSTNLSDTALEALRQDFYAVGNSAGSTGGSAGGGIYNASIGTVEFFNSGYASSSHHLNSNSGMLCSKTHKNFAAASVLAAGTYVAVGTPTISSNVASGPFANYRHGGAEVDEVVDTDGAAFQGVQSLEAVSAGNGYYTCGGFFYAGATGTTTTKAVIKFTSDGTLSVASCNVTGLTSTVSWQQCITKLTGSPTTMKCQFLEGNAAADTGSFRMAGMFFNYGANVETLRLDNTTVGSSNFSLTASDIPTVTNGGKAVWWHTPLYDPNSQWFTTQGDYYMFDATTSSVHSITEIFGYTVAGRLYAQASSDTSLLTDNISMTPNTAYGTSIEWRPLGGGQCSIIVKQDAAAAGTLPTTVINSGSGGCPTQPDAVKLCDRFDATVPSSFLFNGIDWYVLP